MFENYNDLLTIAEVCVMLRVCPGKAYVLVKSGEISGYREKRDWRIKKASVIQYINKHIDNKQM